MWLYCKFQKNAICDSGFIFLIYIFQFEISCKFVWKFDLHKMYIEEWVLMIWRKHLNEVLNVPINNVNILSEKGTNELLGFPNVASQAFFKIISALEIRMLGTSYKYYNNSILLCTKLLSIDLNNCVQASTWLFKNEKIIILVSIPPTS